MILVVVAILCVASVPIAGGRLSALAELDFAGGLGRDRRGGAAGPDRQRAPGGSHGVHVALHVASYALVVLFLIANRHLVGIPIMAIGAGLNMIVIAANGGVMPAASAALRIAGIEQSEDFANSAALDHPTAAAARRRDPDPGPVGDRQRPQRRRPADLRRGADPAARHLPLAPRHAGDAAHRQFS